MLEKRIHFSESKLGLEPSPDIWETYFIPYIGNNKKEIQNYILDQTWYKPRDIIRLLLLSNDFTEIKMLLIKNALIPHANLMQKNHGLNLKNF